MASRILLPTDFGSPLTVGRHNVEIHSDVSIQFERMLANLFCSVDF